MHVEVDAAGRASLPDDLADAASKYFKADVDRPDIDAIAEHYRERDMAAVVFTVDAITSLGHEPIPSEDIAAGAARHADVLIPFGSVDPHRDDAVDRVRRLVEECGVRGFKFHPTVQGFDPSDDALVPDLRRASRSAGVPALFHTGQTGHRRRDAREATASDSGCPARCCSTRSRPTSRTCPIIMAHPSVPWQDEALSIAVHKSNVWIDLSGWSPKYFPAELVRYANTLLKDRVLFGTDFPLISPRTGGCGDLEHTDLKPEVMPGILRDNAVRLLGLGGGT